MMDGTWPALALAGALAVLVGCSVPAPPVADPGSSPQVFPTTAVAPTADAVPVLPEPRAAIIPAPAVSCIPERAVALIVSFEVGSPELYQRKYRNPIYPGGASGPTVGVGYDLGHALPAVILRDWEAHPHAVRMATASGIYGPISPTWVRANADIAVEWGLARQVFDQTNLNQHCQMADRAFGAGLKRLTPDCRGGVVSVVFNRGSSMKGESRLEMRQIRDVCLPAGDESCVASQIRAMSRVNKGTPIERGITRRREAEAALCEA